MLKSFHLGNRTHHLQIIQNNMLSSNMLFQKFILIKVDWQFLTTQLLPQDMKYSSKNRSKKRQHLFVHFGQDSNLFPSKETHKEQKKINPKPSNSPKINPTPNHIVSSDDSWRITNITNFDKTEPKSSLKSCCCRPCPVRAGVGGSVLKWTFLCPDTDALYWKRLLWWVSSHRLLFRGAEIEELLQFS